MSSRFMGRLFGVLACTLLAACSTSQPATPSSTVPEGMNYTRQMPKIATDDMAARGTVVSSSDRTPFDLSQLPPGTRAHTMVYRSVSGITGSPTEVSGAVFIPPGDPPPQGWPVIGYAHGTVGVTPDCGPTVDSRLLGDIIPIAIQLNLGYAVAYTDYAGLGKHAGSSEDAATSHAYLEPKSAAFNLIDAVRAARAVVPQLSPRWVALGSSQGGETAWAAAEYFAAYGQGTDLLGAAALVPTLDMSGLVERAQTSTLTTDQMFLYPNVIEGLAAVDKTIDPDNYLHGVLRDDKETLLACLPPASEGKEALAGSFLPSDAKPSTAIAASRLRERLTSYALPQQPTKVPLLVIYGGSDQTVPPEWTEVAMGRACARGDTILRIRMEGQGHKLDPGAVLGQWIADRFANVPAVGNC
ncbi:lipase family protein [Mycobacterium sp. 1164985.4]|uniref:lipase family protein n=1 Tax=Mycobacterium sp. 1164985.4 TaxID=1834069 RepID=UPI0018D42684|nr:lipase family protein [Mycobacterium sp. 1164985.4]